MSSVLQFIHYFRQMVFLQIFTIYLRYLIGGAFIIAAFAMGKMSGEPLHMNSGGVPIQELQPIQQLFRILGYGGLYWQFIGWAQVISGILLMTQRYAAIGAIIFFGLILNIYIITVNYQFTGTTYVTGLMLLATVFLLLWDLERFQLLFVREMPSLLPVRSKLMVIDQPYWIYVGSIMAVSVIIVSLMRMNILFQLGVPFTEGLIAFILFFAHFSRRAPKIIIS